MTPKTVTVAHSPDSDDAFMFYALATDRLDTGGLEFQHILSDIETLNQRAHDERYDVSAVSIHAFAYLADKYALLASGASMGDRYGPKVVAKEAFRLSELRNRLIAIPGERTSAYLALRMVEPSMRTTVVPFDQIIDHVLDGKADAGLIIHEGQLTYADAGLTQIIDLGEWWYQETGLPLPLGGNVIRRAMGPDRIRQVARLLRESIQYALDHREEALAHAMRYARDLDTSRADRFVGMYVNELTVDYGERGRRAVRTFLDRAHALGLIPHAVPVEFVDA
ncbi:ABC transporter substrate-binding protein [Candidatus Poribacteria bacterium]|nr:ABC transporter substrate-binding protein [Candidatus Poribacteria bacterium]